MGKVLLRDTASGIFDGRGDGAAETDLSNFLLYLHSIVPTEGMNGNVKTIPSSNGSGEKEWEELLALSEDKRADALSGEGVLWTLVNNCGNRNERGRFFQEILTDIGQMNPAQITEILSAEGAIDALSLVSFKSDQMACAQQIMGLIEKLDEGQRVKVFSTENVLTTLVSVLEEIEAKDRGKELLAGAGGAAPVPGAMA